MHTIYKALAPEDIERIISYCKKDNRMFEVYPGPDNSTTVIVNSEDEPLEKFRPLGAFYCNYLGPGIISLDEADPHHDSMPSAQNQIKAIKQTIDSLARKIIA